MKYSYTPGLIKSLCIACVFFLYNQGLGQAMPHPVTSKVDAGQILALAERKAKEWNSLPAIRQFYSLSGYTFFWSRDSVNSRYLQYLLSDAAGYGLHKDDYSTGLSEPGEAITDTAYTELRFTDAALHFFQDLAFGNTEEPVGYNADHYSPACLNVPAMLAKALAEKALDSLIAMLEPRQEGYQAAKDLLRHYVQQTRDSAFRDQVITPGVTDSLLFKRLQQIAIADSVHALLPGNKRKYQLKSIQRFLSLNEDGLIGKTFVEVVNRPLRVRITELEKTLNTFRWMRCLTEEACIVVNIPSATLVTYQQGRQAMVSKVIVGKNATPTSTLLSGITEVVLYPYWTVPQKIAARELLPFIKKDPSYLDKNGFQILDARGKLMQASDIKWPSYSSNNFPFTLRQSTGCDNSLGIIKFNFNSPYGIYLHDTPWKPLFFLSRRYLSHGCVRVDNVTDLARFILQADTTKMQEVLQKGDSLNTTPTILPVHRKIAVLFVYNTAWPALDGSLRFFPDIYQRNNISR